jgi:hypothetical protein
VTNRERKRKERLLRLTHASILQAREGTHKHAVHDWNAPFFTELQSLLLVADVFRRGSFCWMEGGFLVVRACEERRRIPSEGEQRRERDVMKVDAVF